MIDRKQFLRYSGCAAAGAVLGAVGRGLLDHGPTAGPGPSPPSGGPPAPPTARVATPTPAEEMPFEESFSQAGEDMIVRFFLQYKGIPMKSYLDVGANDPVSNNNTYYFYRKGFRGILVEPNVALCKKLRAVRPQDTTLEIGIGVGEEREADYYVMNYDGLNTFSKNVAEDQAKETKGRVQIKEVIKIPLRNINGVMERYLQGAPTFLSVDTEGLDLAILKSIDYRRFRPVIICAETLASNTTDTSGPITAFMTSQGYVARGGSYVNTIFVDSRVL